MDLTKAIAISAAGMDAQGSRLRVISENIANSDSTAQTPGGEPYRRKIVTFRSVFDRQLDASLVHTGPTATAAGDFERRYDPAHPAADAQGYVSLPNVNPLLEMVDMREAQRSYQANLNVIEAAKNMIARAIDLLHG
jgi:flagellar basal-body rod protein FlgC